MAGRVHPDTARHDPARHPTNPDVGLGVYPPVTPILQARRETPARRPRLTLPRTPQRRALTRPPAPDPVPHSRRGLTAQTPWPPPGWSVTGLLDHFAATDRAAALLKAIFDPSRATTAADLDVDAARAAELQQFGEHAEEAVRDAAAAVLAFRDFAQARTHEIDLRAARSGHRGQKEGPPC